MYLTVLSFPVTSEPNESEVSVTCSTMEVMEVPASVATALPDEVINVRDSDLLPAVSGENCTPT
jgi:hypothetical protein